FNNLEAFLLRLAILTLISTLDFCFGFYHTTFAPFTRSTTGLRLAKAKTSTITSQKYSYLTKSIKSKIQELPIALLWNRKILEFPVLYKDLVLPSLTTNLAKSAATSKSLAEYWGLPNMENVEYSIPFCLLKSNRD
ncbi:20686_t:CDS:2, partial [Gigaspora margarita]